MKSAASLKARSKNWYFATVALFLIGCIALSLNAVAKPSMMKDPLLYNYNNTTHQLTYRVSDAFHKNIPVSAWVTLPENPPKGVILYWHGSFLAGTPFTDNRTTPPKNNELIAWIQENLSKDYIIVQPHMIGCGISYGLYKQRWMILDSVKFEGNAILEIVWRLAKEKYKLNESERLDLYQFGSSQGGTNAFAYHMFFQKNTSLQKHYLLKHTYASAGFYSKDVFMQSLLTPYSQYKTDPNVTASFKYASEPSIALSKQMQHLVFASLLYTYQNFNPSLNLSYTNDYDLTSLGAKGDNYMFLSNLYFHYFKADVLALNQISLIKNMNANADFSRPPYLTASSWNELTTHSATRADLSAYIEANSILEVFNTEFKNNQYPITLTCSDNDLNVLSAHSKKIVQISDFPYLTRNACHIPTGTQSEIFSKIHQDPFRYHFKSHVDSIDLLKKALLVNDS
jgi:hypothetical protein